MAQLQPLVSAKTGPYPGATLQLIQGFGNDQNPGQPGCGECFSIVPADPSDLRRVFYFYTTTGHLVFGSPVEWLIETEDAGGVGAPGAWAYTSPYVQWPSWKTFVWEPGSSPATAESARPMRAPTACVLFGSDDTQQVAHGPSFPPDPWCGR
jgi:hypothetical protein